MATNPQSIRTQQFKIVRKGYDTGEVDQFRTEVADALETAQNEATAMEARARAAVARLQDLTRAQAEGADTSAAAEPETAEPAGREVAPTVEESETISRTLLLAQRTADTTVAEARIEADRLLADARERATASDEAARAAREQMIEGAKEEARRAGESERVRVEGEVQALLARRDFLESDVDHLEQFIAAQRERLTEAVAEISAIVQRVPNGLGEMRRPLLSAAAADVGSDGQGEADDDGDEIDERDDIDEMAAGSPGDDETGDVWARRDDDPTPAAEERLFDSDDRPG